MILPIILYSIVSDASFPLGENELMRILEVIWCYGKLEGKQQNKQKNNGMKNYGKERTLRYGKIIR